MKRKILILALAALALGVMATSAIADVTFFFDPNDLIDKYPATAGDENVSGETKATQENARRIHQTWKGTVYDTFYDQTGNYGGTTQPTEYNTYLNWLGGLGTGEGIWRFNAWLKNGAASQTWGEKVVWDLQTGSTPTGTAAPGWNVKTIVAGDWTNCLVEWWTDDPTKYLRPGGADIGQFTFSGTAYWDNDADGYDAHDPEVQPGQSARLWFGTSLEFDANGWGTLAPNGGTFSDTRAGDVGGSEAMLDVNTIPEPFSMAFMGVAFVGVVAARLRRRNAQKRS